MNIKNFFSIIIITLFIFGCGKKAPPEYKKTATIFINKI
tara:strand:- start:701 stop:817 length:117 start_codon:yes stop_codon:yes gene_type:complete